MTLHVDRSTWKCVRLGDVIRRSRRQVDPIESGVERYVAGGHIDSESLTIERWGDPSDGKMGSTFRYVFEPGQVLFVSARPYLRKSGVVDFSGVVADKTYVLDSHRERGLLLELLPLVLSSERFLAFAAAEATGSMNPRLLWGPMQRYEFDLPPMNEQKRIADLLWTIERHRLSVACAHRAACAVLRHVRASMFEGGGDTARADELFDITLGRQRSPKHESGDHILPYLRSANVTLNGIDVTDIKSMNFEPREQVQFALAVGDVLVSEASASAASVGMPAVWQGENPGLVCFQNTLLRYRAIDDVTLPSFLEHFCHWAFETGKFLVASSGTNIRHIGVGGASSMIVRRASISEQEAFVAQARVAGNAVRSLRQELDAVTALLTKLTNELLGVN